MLGKTTDSEAAREVGKDQGRCERAQAEAWESLPYFALPLGSQKKTPCLAKPLTQKWRRSWEGAPFGVMRRRLLLGIHIERRDAWTPEEEALLGKAPDLEVARKLGRTRGAVTMRRTTLKIPPVSNP